eukprot:11204121-Alexandrium_andersonii.AAC.1
MRHAPVKQPDTGAVRSSGRPPIARRRPLLGQLSKETTHTLPALMESARIRAFHAAARPMVE